MGDSKTILNDCLYFTSNALARRLAAMADRCFRPTGLNPSQGFALMCIAERPGISPSAIADQLALAPSSVTRIVEALQRLDLVTTEVEGRRVAAHPTPDGLRRLELVRKAWSQLHDDYAAVLGRSEGDGLCRAIHQAAVALADGDSER